MLKDDVISIANDASSRFTGVPRPPLPGTIAAEPNDVIMSQIVVGYSSSVNKHAHQQAGAKAVYWGPYPGQLHPLERPSLIPWLSAGTTVQSSEAVCVSDEGVVIAGNLYYGAPISDSMNSVGCVWRWGPDGVYTAVALADLSGGAVDSKVHHISGDGRVIVGSGSTERGEEACIWIEQRLSPTTVTWSEPIALGILPGQQYSAANGTDYFGTTIVGVSGVPYDPATETFVQRATLWRRQGATVSAPESVVDMLQTELVGMQVTDEWQTQAKRVSDFGNVITGDCWHPQPNQPGLVQEGWVAGLH